MYVCLSPPHDIYFLGEFGEVEELVFLTVFKHFQPLTTFFNHVQPFSTVSTLFNDLKRFNFCQPIDSMFTVSGFKKNPKS